MPEVITLREIVRELEKHWFSTLCLEAEGIPAGCLHVFSSCGVFNLDGLPSVPEVDIKLNGKTAIYHFFIMLKMHV